jgi:hypothetical protein
MKKILILFIAASCLYGCKKDVAPVKQTNKTHSLSITGSWTESGIDYITSDAPDLAHGNGFPYTLGFEQRYIFGSNASVTKLEIYGADTTKSFVEYSGTYKIIISDNGLDSLIINKTLDNGMWHIGGNNPTIPTIIETVDMSTHIEEWSIYTSKKYTTNAFGVKIDSANYIALTRTGTYNDNGTQYKAVFSEAYLQ